MIGDIMHKIDTGIRRNAEDGGSVFTLKLPERLSVDEAGLLLKIVLQHFKDFKSEVLNNDRGGNAVISLLGELNPLRKGRNIPF